MTQRPAKPAATQTARPGGSTAWPLALLCLALILYLSLYPFTGWRDSGLSCTAYLLASPPRYWTWFDIITNYLGYIPFGFLLALAMLRSDSPELRRWGPLLAALAGVAMSFTMETTQCWLPQRTSSNLDLALNSAGALSGGLLAWLIEKLGVFGRWQRWASEGLVPGYQGELALLLVWPLALLYPLPVPFGLGQILERLEKLLAEWLQDTPFLDWLPMRAIEFQPMLPEIEYVVMALGLLAVCLLAFGILRGRVERLLALLLLALAGVLATGLALKLSLRADVSWAWSWQPLQISLAAAVAAAIACLWLPPRLCAALALLLLLAQLYLLNQAAIPVYHDWMLSTAMRADFRRFYGMAQWLGWCWPWLALLLLARRTLKPPR